MLRENLEQLVNNRTAATATQTRIISPNNLRRLRKARKESKTAIFSAKEEWTAAFAKSVERGQKSGGTKVLGGSQEDQVRMERDEARHAHEVQKG